MVSKEQGSFSFREADTGSREAVEQLKARQGRVVMRQIITHTLAQGVATLKALNHM